MLVLGARLPGMAPTDLWNLSVCLACRNLLMTGPLCVAEFVAAALLLLLDPLLALIGVPILFLQCLRLTSQLGIRKVERNTSRPGVAALLPERHAPRCTDTLAGTSVVSVVDREARYNDRSR